MVLLIKPLERAAVQIKRIYPKICLLFRITDQLQVLLNLVINAVSVPDGGLIGLSQIEQLSLF
jgi:hypothetical protein